MLTEKEKKVIADWVWQLDKAYDDRKWNKALKNNKIDIVGNNLELQVYNNLAIQGYIKSFPQFLLGSLDYYDFREHCYDASFSEYKAYALFFETIINCKNVDYREGKYYLSSLKDYDGIYKR